MDLRNLFRRGRPAAEWPPQRELALAMIALSRPELPPPAAVEACLRDSWPALGITAESVAPERGEAGLQLRRPDGASVLVGLVAAPIPAGDLASPIEAAGWYWPAAAAALGAHQAHAVVAAQRPGGLDAIELDLFLTQATAAVAAASGEGAVGVYWGAGGVVHAPETFVWWAQQASREQLPLYLWLAFLARRWGDGGDVIATRGLAAYGLMEVEVVARPGADPEMLMERAFTAAHYLLEHGPVLRDGDTFGLSAAERIRVRHVPSVDDATRTVYRLML